MVKKKEIYGIVPFTQAVRGENKIGFKDLEGNIVIKAKYEEYGTRNTEMIGGLSTFVQGSRCWWSIINNNARLIVEKAFHSEVYEEGVGVYRSMSETLVNGEKINVYDMCGMVDYGGNVVLPCAYDIIKRIKKKYFYLAKGKDHGVYRITDDKTVSLCFDLKGAGYEPLMIEKSFGNENVFNTSGEERLLEVKKNGLSVVIKDDGTEVVPCIYQNIRRFGPTGVIGFANNEMFLIKFDDPDNISIEPYKP